MFILSLACNAAGLKLALATSPRIFKLSRRRRWDAGFADSLERATTFIHLIFLQKLSTLCWAEHLRLSVAPASVTDVGGEALLH